ncbi:MAG: cadherin domain-containing protein [Chloroflexota bacterium]
MDNRLINKQDNSIKQAKRIGIIFFICLFVFVVMLGATAVFVQASTVSKTNSTDGLADRKEITRTVTFSGGDFAAGARVSSVILSVEIEKTDVSCGNYTGSNVFNREMYMMLRSPNGTQIALIESILGNAGSGNPSTFSSNTAYNGVVPITFDDDAATQIGGTAPITGTFRPEESLSAFVGEDPLGDWVLTIGDTTNGAPFCFYEMTLEISADQPPVADDQIFSVAEDVVDGTAVDTVVVTDGDVGDKFTFIETGGTGLAVFEIDESTGVISVTDSTQLDFENPAMDQYTYIIEVTDSGALTDTATITINVTDANDGPTDISLAPNTVAEHQPALTTVGTLTTTDADAADTFTYSLVAGTGDTDNGSFQINGSDVETAVELDYDLQITYTIRVETNDGNGGLFAKPLTITVTDGNDPPTNLTIDNSTIEENQPTNTLVGKFSTTDPNGGPFTYSLVAGAGDADNGDFIIATDELRTNVVFDFETLPTTRTIRVETDDGSGGTLEEAFIISITNANDPATEFNLSNQTITESLPISTTIGSFTAVDIDGGTYTYTLATGAGDADNGNFAIVGDELKSGIIFDYESQITHTIRVEQNDGISTTESVFSIVVLNENEDPTDIGLSPASVMEHQAAGTTVGALSTTDGDMGDTHTYSLVVGSGDDDNVLFQISGSQLETAVELDHEVQMTRTVRIETNDGFGGTYQEAFVITVVDGNDPPNDITLDNNTIQENQPAGTAVGNLSAVDPNGDSPLTYTLPIGTPDNSSFQIVAAQLQSATSFDREADDTYNIMVQVDDGNGATFQKAMTITITDGNDTPTGISLMPASVLENQPIGTTVGTLDSEDDDTGDTHTYTLVAGAGDTDNGLFTVDGTELDTNAVFDFETAPASYSVRMQTEDGMGGFYTQTLAITISNGNDAPNDITIDSTTFEENLPVGSEVGSFSTSDPDTGDIHSYSLVAGAGDDDNAQFVITDEILETNATFDFEADPLTYTIRVQTSDGGLTYTEVITLNLINGNDAPVAAPDFGGTVDEDSLLTVAAGSGVLVNDSDEDAGDTITVTSFDTLSDNGAIVSVSSDGGFSFDPRGAAAIQSLQVGQSLVDSFEYVVEDSGGLTDTGVVTVTISGLNDDPTAGTDSVFTPQDQDITISVLTNDIDPENDTLTIDSVTQPAEGTVTNNGDGSVTYSPPAGYIGNDTFTYTISDGNGGSSTGTVNVAVGESKAFLPIGVLDYTPAPDLVVTDIEATADEIRVEITNEGAVATADGFWVDFYIDPDPVPTEEDQVWQDVSDEGLVWGINISLAPGESLTLVYSTAPGAPNLYYSSENSSYSGNLPANTTVYAHVDSAHLTTDYGGVLESHEIYDQTYNNISGPYVSTSP